MSKKYICDGCGFEKSGWDADRDVSTLWGRFTVNHPDHARDESFDLCYECAKKNTSRNKKHLY